MLASKTGMFAKILSHVRGGGDIRTCLEYGSNIGLNLIALRQLIPDIEVSAIEINAKAAERCSKIPGVHVHNESIYEFDSDEQFDLTLVSGVLIHQNPEKLPEAYDQLYTHSRRYVLIIEYYNPTPVTVTYRGNEDRLFKRDFAGEFMDRHPDVKLLGYGFQYHRDPVFPVDDATWFLMEKK
ncbi:MAG: pseudaminic acid biosynthesis-associated methylase [Selenomonas sp.]|nr:pseudaminic acid biosynthesis-associated methylase [Selenomonas sp.]